MQKRGRAMDLRIGGQVIQNIHIKIPIPPFEEQEEIMSIIDEIVG